MLTWRTRFLGAGVLLTLLGASTLVAADEPAFHFKLRTGLTAGSLQKNFADNKIMGVGVEAAFPAPGGQWTAEIGFDYIAGRGRDTLAFPADPVYYNPNAPSTTYNGQKLYLNLRSYDVRKESAAGFSFRGGYRADLPWPSLSWHGGVSLDAYKVSSEFSAYYRPRYGNDLPVFYDAAAKLDYYEGYANSIQGTKLALGLYAGLGYDWAPGFRTELSARSLGMAHRDYRPFTLTGRYSGQPMAAGLLEEKTTRGLALEISLAMKF